MDDAAPSAKPPRTLGPAPLCRCGATAPLTDLGDSDISLRDRIVPVRVAACSQCGEVRLVVLSTGERRGGTRRPGSKGG